VLDRHATQAVNRLTASLAKLPERTEAIELTIFVDQGGEGFLGIRVSLVGPDLYVLNAAIADSAVLFETRMIDRRMVPDLPLMDPFDTEFSVHDALTDCAADWLAGVWANTDTSTVVVPVTIVSHDEYGTRTPIVLKN
jgi:hypothetical protein